MSVTLSMSNLSLMALLVALLLGILRDMNEPAELFSSAFFLILANLGATFLDFILSGKFGYISLFCGLGVFWSAFSCRTSTPRWFFWSSMALTTILVTYQTSTSGYFTTVFETINLLNLHIACAILGQIAMLVSCFGAVAYLWQQRALKRRDMSWLTNPFWPLETIDEFLSSFLAAGFCFLTVALLSGLSLYVLFDMNSSLFIHKLLVTFAIWAWYLVSLCFRKLFTISTKTVAKMSLSGFALLSFVLFGYSTNF